ncbi:MAG: hypothetical protein BWX73_02928 [Lentisphaerae bacterium ADurb.Bin082]|nr:MAG: hypothetical protein BWX73_02928 [Lentisphaerae bacterium ADurb.Bin082]
MLKKLYIDNFRCMQNFSVTLTNYQLWLGSNGSGKTSVLDVLRNLQRVLAAENVADIFKRNSLTVWDMRLVQTFRVELEIGGEDYEYELAIEHMKGEERCRIQEEKLIWKGSTFYHFDGSEAHLYRINNNSGKVEEGTHFTADWSRSVIPTIAERDDNRPLIRFREEVRKWLIVQPIPISKMMTSSARNESPDLNRYCENFSEWYRYILQESPGIGYDARQLLTPVIPGFDELSLRDAGDSRMLKATLRIGNKDYVFDFQELSDGQRQLILLYTLLAALKKGIFTTLFIDEPNNFVALREIQPWINEVHDVCDDMERQVVIISHHPEIINLMARGNERWFTRKENGPVECKDRLPQTPGLSPAETVARGWENE